MPRGSSRKRSRSNDWSKEPLHLGDPLRNVDCALGSVEAHGAPSSEALTTRVPDRSRL